MKLDKPKIGCYMFKKHFAVIEDDNYDNKVNNRRIEDKMKLERMGIILVDNYDDIIEFGLNKDTKKKKIGKYTLDIFLERAYSIHNNKYDYSNIKESDNINSKSKVNLTCNKCLYNWNVSITGHLNSKYGVHRAQELHR